MNYDKYADRKFNDSFDKIDFYSEGPKGRIRMQVAFDATTLDNLYSLAFGPVYGGHLIDDRARNNNNDTYKILATIEAIVDSYTKRFPERWVYFEGSTPARTRLYRMAIGINFKELSEKYLIYGYYADTFMPFTENMIANGFLVKRKN